MEYDDFKSWQELGITGVEIIENNETPEELETRIKDEDGVPIMPRIT